MPTTEELLRLADIMVDNDTTVYRKLNEGLFSQSLFNEMRKTVPIITDVCGLLSGYAGEVDVNYILISPDQMHAMVRHMKNRTKSKQTIIETSGGKAFFIGICKAEGEPLSTVTDPAKIVAGVS